MEELQHIEIFNDVFAHRERFVRFAFSYLQDLSAAEDLVMDSFVYYWENRQRLDCKGNVPAYNLTVVKHKCLDYLQLQKNTSGCLFAVAGRCPLGTGHEYRFA